MCFQLCMIFQEEESNQESCSIVLRRMTTDRAENTDLTTFFFFIVLGPPGSLLFLAYLVDGKTLVNMLWNGWAVYISWHGRLIMCVEDWRKAVVEPLYKNKGEWNRKGKWLGVCQLSICSSVPHSLLLSFPTYGLEPPTCCREGDDDDSGNVRSTYWGGHQFSFATTGTTITTIFFAVNMFTLMGQVLAESVAFFLKTISVSDSYWPHTQLSTLLHVWPSVAHSAQLPVFSWSDEKCWGWDWWWQQWWSRYGGRHAFSQQNPARYRHTTTARAAETAGRGKGWWATAWWALH